jgi:hypothetical protein
VPLDEQPERGSIACTGQPDQVTVADVHTCYCQAAIRVLPIRSAP